MKKIITAVLAVLTLFLCGNAEAVPNSFKGMTSYASGDGFRVVMAFDHSPKTIVKYYEKSIQVDVPGGMVHPAKRVFDVNKAGVKTINVYQVKPDLLRIRIFPEKSVSDLKQSFSTSKAGEKFVVSLAHQAPAVSEKLTSEPLPMSKTLPEDIKQSAVGETDSMLEDVKAEKISERAVAPGAMKIASVSAEAEKKAAGGEADVSDAEMLANLQKSLEDIKKESSVDTKPFAGGEKARQAAFVPETPSSVPSMGEAFIKIGGALMIVVSLILLAAFGAKKYLGAVEGGLGAKKQMKVLSNHFIGVKKNVTIIEVAGEVLVLGVTNSNVNLLARYTEPEKIESIKLAHRLPDKPMGVFKKFPLFGWLEKRRAANKPLNPAFARQVASYAQGMKDAETAKKDTIETRKDEMVSSVTRSIADRLKTMEGAA